MPIVGDWVAIRPSETERKGTIEAILPRLSCFSRKAAGEPTRRQFVAANIDTVFLVCGLDGDFNLRRIERYLAAIGDSGATAVIVLNKADVCPDVDAARSATGALAPGVIFVLLVMAVVVITIIALLIAIVLMLRFAAEFREPTSRTQQAMGGRRQPDSRQNPHHDEPK